MENELIYICEICQTVLDEHHCKAVCPNCGRMFDCSDLPLIQANARIEHDRVVARTDSSMNDMLHKSAPDSDSTPPADNGNVANLP